MRTNVYIDGFNLYFGAVKGTPYKWLDLEKLCRFALPEHKINRIRYFTAPVENTPDDPGKSARQAIYLRALATIPNLTIKKGLFLTHNVRLPLASPPANGPRTVEVTKREEKGSDVNLATALLVDAFDGDFELAVVVSNDSDLVEPINVVRTRLGLPVGVLNPHQRQSRELEKVATFCRHIRTRLLSSCQFPDTLEDEHGVIRKPATW